MTTILIDDNGTFLTLREICERCGINDIALKELVALGVADPNGKRVEEWRFSTGQYLRIRRAVTLQKDLGINESGAALALDLLDEIARMKEEIDYLQRHMFGD